VYKGKYKGQVVALKVLRLESKQRDLDDFKKYVSPPTPNTHVTNTPLY